jgi:aryl-alcohol dehydrogenase-like predicted oxidoreductase
MADLETRPVGATGLRVTLIGFGALEIGRDWGLGDAGRRARPGEAAACAVLRAALDLGVTLIDTASAYHASEERIGRCLAADRARYTLASKCGEHNAEPATYYDFSYDAIRESIGRSCALLQTEVIDIMQIHFGPDPLAVLDDGGCVRAMREAQAAGAVRFLGASVDGAPLARCIASGDFAVAQVGYSLLRQGEAARIQEAQARGMGVFVRSGLAGGWLTPRALAVPEAERPPAVRALLALCGGDARLLQALALHFLARNPAVSAILVGTKSAANLREAIALLATPPPAGLLDEAIRVTQAHAAP